ncbi:hypothetical protein NXH76_20480 [Blautia schinkii]|nr:hypothetical protein [Blautia schinkii]
MMKQPVTKKLSEKKVKSTVVGTEKSPYQKLFPDEQFYQIPRYPQIFISQYGNIISTCGKVPHVLSPFVEESGYTGIVLSKHGKKKKHYVHRLVAEVWCKKPDFTLDYPLQVHHKRKVRQNPSIAVNFATNLEYVYLPYHKFLDSITSIQLQRKSGTWKYVSEIPEIAEYYKSSEQQIYQILTGQPQWTEGKTRYYELNNIHLKVRER